MSTPLKILHVEAGQHLYGGALQVFYLLRGLKARGVENILVCPRGSAIAQACQGIATVHEVALRGDLDLLFIPRLRRIIKQARPDLVHLHSRRGADTLGGIAARLSGAKCIVSRRVDNPESPFIARLKYRIYDHVVTISEGIRAVLLAEGVPAARVTCVHSAVDKDKFDRPCEREWFAAEFDLAPNTRALAVIAQLIPRKGHRHLLAILPEVLRQHPDVRVLFFGKGPLADELRQAIVQVGVQDQVRLAGFRDDLERVLPCLYGVVHPADMEGLGVSLLQAAAAGVPIIGTQAGGIPEIVRDGVNGYLIPPQSPEALRVALLKLLADEADAQRMGRAGQAIVTAEFSIQAMVAGNLRVYERLLRGSN
ncbi:MAG: glycosyltransferase [Pseudomonadota bacterium]